MDSFMEAMKTVFRSFLQVRRAPLIPFMAISILLSVTVVSIKVCAEDPHLKKAKQSYEAGDFSRAVSEAEAYLQKDPTSTVALVLLGDAHAAMAEMTRGSVAVYREHVCAAIKAWKKSMGKRYNNNIHARIAVLEQQTQDMVDSQGRYLGPCEASEVRGSETAP